MSPAIRTLWLAPALLAAASCATTPSAPPAPPPPPKPWVRTPPPAPLALTPWSEPSAQETPLPNGMKIIVIPRRGQPLVSIRLLLRAGAVHEQAGSAGATWLALASLEDTFEKRNEEGDILVWDEKSARRQVAEQGGTLSFGVAHDASWLSLDGYSADTGKYLQTLREVIGARRQGRSGFVGRRNALMDAIEDLELGDDQTVGEQLTRLAFGAQHPYSQRVIGSMQSLGELGLEDIARQQELVLQPRGATLLVVGDVDAADISARAARIFKSWSNTEVLAEPPLAAPKVATRQAVHLIARTPARTTALCAARALSDVAVSDAAVEVFAEVLSNQRLRPALREERGLTYGVQAIHVRHRRARAMVFCTRLPTAQTGEGLGVFLKTLAEMRATAPSAEEIERAKSTLQARLAADRADVTGLASAWSRALQTGRPAGLAEQQRALASVEAAELEKLRGRVLEPNRLQFLLTGERGAMEAAVRASGLGRSVMVNVAHE